MKLGFAVQVLGRPGLKPNDTRRWQNNPHLSVSLAYLRDILFYLEQKDMRMYRMSSDLAPYVTHPDLPQFHGQIAECASELAACGQAARQANIRLSLHPGIHTVLNSPDETVFHKAVTDLYAQTQILDLMGLGPEAVIVVHVGGLYGDKHAAMERFIRRFCALDNAIRQRVVLENDDRLYNLRDIYAIHRETGIRLVLDQLHHLCNPAPNLSLLAALDLALNTWPVGQTPKIHFSTPRTSIQVVRRRIKSISTDRQLREPRLTEHADLIDPFAFIDLLRTAQQERDFDVMLECKAKDLALLRLRKHLDALAPELVARYQIV
jgi:UV DNA damage endonuclease